MVVADRPRPSAEAVCFDAPVVELLDPAAARTPSHGSSPSAPTCVCPTPDLDEVARRLAALDPATPIGVVLLDQTVASGIGNVYKSEALWAESLDPFAPLSSIEPRRRGERCTATAPRPAAGQPATSGPRRTVAARRSPSTIAPGAHADDAARRSVPGGKVPTGRSTWWCPACQT